MIGGLSCNARSLNRHISYWKRGRCLCGHILWGFDDVDRAIFRVWDNESNTILILLLSTVQQRETKAASGDIC